MVATHAITCSSINNSLTMANHCMHAHLLTVLFHSSHAISLSPELFQYNAQLALYNFQWADYMEYYMCEMVYFLRAGHKFSTQYVTGHLAHKLNWKYKLLMPPHGQIEIYQLDFFFKKIRIFDLFSYSGQILPIHNLKKWRM